MAVVPTILLTTFLVVTGIGLVMWRSGGGSWLLRAGAMNAAFAAAILLRNSGQGWQAAAWAVFAMFLLTNLVTIKGEVWRRIRLETLLAGAAILTLAVSQFVDETSRLQIPVAVLLAVLTMAFIAPIFLRTIPRFI